MNEFISRAQAQRLLGCDKKAMIRLLLSGEIESSRKENGGWLVSRESLDKFISQKTERIANIEELQRIIAVYKEENRVLMQLLKDNGIQYDGNLEQKPSIPTTTLFDLNLPPRALVVLYKYKINTIEQLRSMEFIDLLRLEGIGKKTALLIKEKLDAIRV